MTADEAYLALHKVWTALQPDVLAIPDERQQYGAPTGPIPRPPRPYATIWAKTPASDAFYGIDSASSDTEIERSQAVYFQAEINTFGAPGALQAFYRATRGSFAGAEEFRAQGLGVARIITAPRVISLALETRVELREMLELELSATDTFKDLATTATEVHGLTTVSGETIEFEVTT